jgi:hypothetical protein
VYLVLVELEEKKQTAFWNWSKIFARGETMERREREGAGYRS